MRRMLLVSGKIACPPWELGVEVEAESKLHPLPPVETERDGCALAFDICAQAESQIINASVLNTVTSHRQCWPAEAAEEQSIDE